MCAVGPERRDHRHGLPDVAPVRREVVARIVGGRDNADVETGKELLRRPVGQLPVRLLPDLARGRGVELEIDPEDPAQLEMRPDIERVADQAGDGGRPGREPFPRIGVPRDETLLEPREAHGSPLVVVVAEPEIRQRLVDTVVGDVGGGEVVVKIDDRSVLGDLVEQGACGLAREQEVVRQESSVHPAAFRSSSR